MKPSRRFVVQVGNNVSRSNSIELAATHLGDKLSISNTDLRRQLLKHGIAIIVKCDTQGYIFDTQFVTNDNTQLK